MDKQLILKSVGTVAVAFLVSAPVAADSQWGRLSDNALQSKTYLSGGFASVDFEDSSGSATGWENDSESTLWVHGGLRYSEYFSLKAGYDMLGETESGAIEYGGANLGARIHLPLSLFNLPVQGTSIYGTGGLGMARAEDNRFNRSSETEFGSFFEVGAEVAVYGRFYADVGYRRYAMDFDLANGETAEMEFDIAFFGAGARF